LNSVYCGSDPDGNHAEPKKIDGTWHITGDLNIRTKGYIKKVLGNMKIITDAFPDCALVVLDPIPRYVLSKCCECEEHIMNFSDPGYIADISEGREMVDKMITGWLQSIPTPSMVVDCRAGTDEPDLPLPDLCTGGKSVWQLADPVHASPELYANLALAVAAAMDDLGLAVNGGHTKRPRLDSLVVKREVNSPPAGARPQSWSAGKLPAPPKRGRGGQQGPSRGRPYWRGGRGGRGSRGGQYAGRGLFWRPVRGGRKF
jgi:hypothetical protein